MKQELSKCLQLDWFKEGHISNHSRDLSLLLEYNGLSSSQRSSHKITSHFFFFFAKYIRHLQYLHNYGFILFGFSNNLYVLISPAPLSVFYLVLQILGQRVHDSFCLEYSSVAHLHSPFQLPFTHLSDPALGISFSGRLMWQSPSVRIGQPSECCNSTVQVFLMAPFNFTSANCPFSHWAISSVSNTMLGSYLLGMQYVCVHCSWSFVSFP